MYLKTEEKAKAYDRAKEKIVLRFGSNVAEEIFSEFDESEDEKIISAIRKAIEAKVENLGNGVTRTACLAWLEKQGEQKSFDYENTNIPQKDSTWSEEDKHWMQKVIDFMNHPDLIKATPTLAKDTINWLKSLKDRVQPQSKQEWSEEDESNFQGIIDELKANKHHAPDSDLPTYDRFLSWFKSLKDRYTWKPSDEQMKVCKEVYADLLSAKGFDVGTINSELNRLEEKLKK